MTVASVPKTVSPENVLGLIEPGMRIFLSTGVAEPRTLIRHLMASESGNLQDLELIQLVSLGDAVPMEDRFARKYRLKTFFSGWVASEAITAGWVDLIPCPFSRIPGLIASGALELDAAFVQVSPPDEAGYVNLGVAVDAARQAMAQASLVVGEVNEEIPQTLGDTFVPVSDFHYLVQAKDPPILFPRWPVAEAFDRVAANVASMVGDGSCLAFSIGPLYEALGRHLTDKRDLGIQGPFFTDALMDLVEAGAVTNRKKQIFQGKSLVSYALGTKGLMQWLHRNPLVEFQGIDKVADPRNIALNERFVAILPARKVDLTGNIAMQTGKGNVSAGPGEAQEFFAGTAFSRGGRTIFALPSRNLKGEPNIILSVEGFPNQFTARESLDLVVTDYGVASLSGRTIRERALALIEIAHPDDREVLVQKAKEAKIVYSDQIYLTGSGHHYPDELSCMHTFPGRLKVRFRAIRPSDEEEMRRLFYRFSDEGVYYRYFTPIKAMPHPRMQEYVNVDYEDTLSMVGVVGGPRGERIIAEGRYVRPRGASYADIAMVVDEACQRKGIATYLLRMLIRIARERAIQGFTGDVLAHNTGIRKVLQRAPFAVRTTLEQGGFYRITIPFAERR